MIKNNSFVDVKHRFTAILIDLSVLQILYIITEVIKLNRIISKNSINLLDGVISSWYFIILLSSRYQATIGGILLSFKIVNSKSFDRLNMLQSCKLVLAKNILPLLIIFIISYYVTNISDNTTLFQYIVGLSEYEKEFIGFIIYFIMESLGYISIYFTNEKTSLYDIMCGTRFIYNQKQTKSDLGLKFVGLLKRISIVLIDFAIISILAWSILKFYNLSLIQGYMLFILLDFSYSIFLHLISVKGTIGMIVTKVKMVKLYYFSSIYYRYILNGTYLVPVFLIVENNETLAEYFITLIITWTIANIITISITDEKTSISDIVTGIRIVAK